MKIPSAPAIADIVVTVVSTKSEPVPMPLPALKNKALDVISISESPSVISPPAITATFPVPAVINSKVILFVASSLTWPSLLTIDVVSNEIISFEAFKSMVFPLPSVWTFPPALINKSLLEFKLRFSSKDFTVAFKIKSKEPPVFINKSLVALTAPPLSIVIEPEVVCNTNAPVVTTLLWATSVFIDAVTLPSNFTRFTTMSLTVSKIKLSDSVINKPPLPTFALNVATVVSIWLSKAPKPPVPVTLTRNSSAVTFCSVVPASVIAVDNKLTLPLVFNIPKTKVVLALYLMLPVPASAAAPFVIAIKPFVVSISILPAVVFKSPSADCLIFVEASNVIDPDVASIFEFTSISKLDAFTKMLPVPLAKIPVVSSPPLISISVAINTIEPLVVVFKSSWAATSLITPVPTLLIEIASIFVTIIASVSFK